MNKYKVIGTMSGTSLDGLDIAFCELTLRNNKWSYKIVKAQTIKYSKTQKQKLATIENGTALNIINDHAEYGHYVGKQIHKFIKKNNLTPQFISSHGHTIFHQPKKGITFQLGSGAAIAAECQLPVVCDFRSLDVALKGQGAPLVPIGDHLLFSNYQFCLNLGGFANVSFTNLKSNKRRIERIAFDVCPANIVLNELCKKINKEYDNKGQIAGSGKINAKLLNELNALKFYHQQKLKPKSLGKEWVLSNIYPILNKYPIPIADLLCTMVEHIAVQITNSTSSINSASIFITGGGAYNNYLIKRIKALTNHRIIIPDTNTIEFKEALIFAFLGVLRMRNETNTLKSVTGATKDSIGGAVYFGV